MNIFKRGGEDTCSNEIRFKPLLEVILARTRATRLLKPKHKTITQLYTFSSVN